MISFPPAIFNSAQLIVLFGVIFIIVGLTVMGAAALCAWVS